MLPDFVTYDALWEGGKPFYPSKDSARWAIRRHGPALADAHALAFHRGRLLVHLPRFAAVMERAAVEEARKRFG